MAEATHTQTMHKGERAVERRAFLALLERHGHRAVNRLGQNFLWDMDLLSELADLAGVQPGERVLEIGSGAGSLTAALLEKVGAAGRVFSCEVDSHLEGLLAERFAGEARLELKLADALKLDFSHWPERGEDEMPLRVAANIPYYITTELISRLLIQAPDARSMSFLVQEEAAARILARPEDGKCYGPLAVLVQAYGCGHIVKRVPRGAFVPAPRVDSVFIKIERGSDAGDDWRARLYPQMQVFAGFLQVLFRQRRKTLANNLKALPAAERERVERALADLGLSAASRAESLDWLSLARIFLQSREV